MRGGPWRRALETLRKLPPGWAEVLTRGRVLLGGGGGLSFVTFAGLL
jgi:hypothetical protein